MKNYSFLGDKIIFISDHRSDSVVNDIAKRHGAALSHLRNVHALQNDDIPEWLLISAQYDKTYIDDILKFLDSCDQGFTILYDAAYLEFKTYFQLFMKDARIIPTSGAIKYTK